MMHSKNGGAPSGKLTELKLGLTGVLGAMVFNAGTSAKCELGFGYICANAPMDSYTLEFKDGVPQVPPGT
eukprot:3264006-Rhodomonas_salina.2